MRTYRELFRTPQFGPLFATSAVQVAGSTMSGLALGTHVYAATDSPLLAALSMFGSSLAQVLGATVLMSAADRLPPRAATTGLALAFGLATAVLAVPGLPLPVVFAIILAEGWSRPWAAVCGTGCSMRCCPRTVICWGVPY